MSQQPVTEAFDANKHVAVVVDAGTVPDEAPLDNDRPDIPPVSAYSKGAVVTHVKTKQKAVIHRVDHVTRLIRLWYPDRKHLPVKDQFDSRTTWHSFETWEPEIMLSPGEVERQQAVVLFKQELEAFDANGLQFVMAFCDDDDPIKALAKVRGLKTSGLLNMKVQAPQAEPVVAAAMPEEPNAPKKGNR
jgi:hypothetical protein